MSPEDILKAAALMIESANGTRTEYLDYQGKYNEVSPEKIDWDWARGLQSYRLKPSSPQVFMHRLLRCQDERPQADHAFEPLPPCVELTPEIIDAVRDAGIQLKDPDGNPI